jgi:WS/DGAT/MGAT family acyltransferase
MAVMILDPGTVPGGYSFQGLREFIAERLSLVPPLRRRIVEVPFGIDRPRWVELDEVDIDYHVRRAAVPAPGGEREVAELASDLNDLPFDPEKPFWRLLVVEGLEDGRIAIVAKLHHAMMDGITGIKYMAVLLGDGPASALPLPSAKEGDGDEIPGDWQLLAEALPTVLMRPLRIAQLAGGLAVSMLGGLFRGSGADDVEPREVPHTIFNRRSSPDRSFAYDSLPIDEIRDVASKTDSTVNDVVLALTSTALQRYLEARDAMPDESLAAGIPISLHEEGDEHANAYSVVIPSLATDVDDPVERLERIRDETLALKAAQRESGGIGDMLDVVEVLPPWIYNVMARLYTGLHVIERMERPFFNVLVSSVPGPPAALYFAGARILGLHPLGPVYDGMLINITAIGREDTLDVGLVACRQGVPGLEEIARELPRALEDLRSALGLEARRPSEIEPD